MGIRAGWRSRMRLVRPLVFVLMGLTVLAVLGDGASVAQRQTGPSASGASEVRRAIEKAEQVLAELDAIEQRWQQQEGAAEERLEQLLEILVALEASLADAADRSEDVERIFDRLKPMTLTALQTLDRLVDHIRRPSEIPVPGLLAAGDETGALGPPRSGAASVRQSEEIARLIDLREQEAHRVRELSALEIQLRLDSIDRHLEVTKRIWLLRLDALQRLPRARRAEVLSWHGEGLEEIEIEIDAAETVVELQWIRTKAFFISFGRHAKGIASAFRVGNLTLQILLVVLLWRLLQSNRDRYLQRLRRRLQGIKDPRQLQRAKSGVDFIESIAPWGIFLLAIGALRWVLGEELIWTTGLTLAFIIATVYAVYRLVSDTAMGLLYNVMDRAGMRMSEELRGRFNRHVRWVLRLGALVAVVVIFLEARLGQGVLYIHTRNLGTVVVLLGFVLVAGSLREAIAEMYLASRAHGWLADLVRRTRGRWTAHLVAPLALLWLVGWSLLHVLQSAVSSFEQARLANVFLSRRQLERSAERVGYARGRLEDLPTELVTALDSTVTVADLERLDCFTGMDVVRSSIAQWREGEGGGSFLLAGDEGIGKRAWVSRLADLEGIEARFQLDRRLMNGGALLRWLASRLLGEDKTLRRADLVSGLEAGARRVVVVERAERLFLTTVNGYRALAELGPVIDATRHRIFWVLSMGELAWNHLRAAGKDLAFLRRKEELPRWSESRIRSLIETRLEQGGYRVDYAELLGRRSRREDREARDRWGEQAFLNLLWDFSGGNPKVALHHFLRSLDPEGEELHVRPLRPLPEGDLQEAGGAALFILAAIARHGSLSAREAALATNYPVDRVQARMIRLQDSAVIAETAGSFRVTTQWRSTALRALRRDNILVS